MSTLIKANKNIQKLINVARSNIDTQFELHEAQRKQQENALQEYADAIDALHAAVNVHHSAIEKMCNQHIKTKRKFFVGQKIKRLQPVPEETTDAVVAQILNDPKVIEAFDDFVDAMHETDLVLLVDRKHMITSWVNNNVNLMREWLLFNNEAAAGHCFSLPDCYWSGTRRRMIDNQNQRVTDAIRMYNKKINVAEKLWEVTDHVTQDLVTNLVAACEFQAMPEQS